MPRFVADANAKMRAATYVLGPQECDHHCWNMCLATKSTHITYIETWRDKYICIYTVNMYIYIYINNLFFSGCLFWPLSFPPAKGQCGSCLGDEVQEMPQSCVWPHGVIELSHSWGFQPFLHGLQFVGMPRSMRRKLLLKSLKRKSQWKTKTGMAVAKPPHPDPRRTSSVTQGMLARGSALESLSKMFLENLLYPLWNNCGHPAQLNLAG